MQRRGKAGRRRGAPDAKYNSVWMEMFTRKLMYSGKKSTAERVMYNSLGIIEQRTHRNPMETFDQAGRNAMPVLEVRPRRVGGATYQIPLEVRPERQLSLAMRWLPAAARARQGGPVRGRPAG